VDVSQSALSQHLAVLREAGIVTTRREAQTIWYTLAEGPAHAVMAALHASFCAPRRRAAAPRR
jgi:DNA-binding transcriptional ArsR family regulator